MNDTLAALEKLFGSNINLTIADVVSLLEGNPVSIPVDPFNQALSAVGKTLTVSLAANAVTIQVH